MNRGHKMHLKRNRAESLGCHDRHPLPRACLREPGSRDVINWQWRYVIHAQMICYRNNSYLHDVPECLLVKNCPTPSGLPIPVTNKIQNAIQYKDRSLDWWCFAHTMTSARARGRSNRLLRRPYATPDWRWFWHANKIYGITAFMLNELYQNMPVFLEDNFLILEHKVSFGFVPYPSSVLIYKKSSTGETGLDSPTVMSVERSVTKGQSPRLGSASIYGQW